MDGSGEEVMKIEKTEKGYVIVRGKYQDQFFSFFVDYDSSSWTKHVYNARLYAKRSLAEEELLEIRKRAKDRLVLREGICRATGRTCNIPSHWGS